MDTRTILRLLIALVIALVANKVATLPALAAESWKWSDTSNGEEVPLQSCKGFELTAEYTITREHRVVVNDFGRQIQERQNVHFWGSISSSITIQVLQYEGEFVRTIDVDKNEKMDSNFVLRLGSPSTEEISIAHARPNLESIDNPLNILLEFAPNSAGAGLCGLFGGTTAVEHGTATGPQIPLSPPPNLSTGCDLAPQDPARPQSENSCDSEDSAL
jgi:hypothetical protein